jgi:hypothetical protein
LNLEDILSKNKSLRNIHTGKRCFIIGNGPSISLQDLLPLRDEISIVVSSFYRHPDAKTINPAYWVMADPLIWEKPDECFFPAFKFAFDMGVSPKLFVPIGGFSFFAGINTGAPINHHFFHYDTQKKIDTIIDFSVGIPPYGQNVIIVCLMLAYYLGCNPIYFIGCDHDFMNASEEQYRNLEIKHFYNNPDVSKKKLSMKWDQFCNAKQRMYYEYDQLKQYAFLWGFDVYNATLGGYFDTFPRVQYDSLFVRPVDLLERKKQQGYDADAMNLAQNAVKLMNEGADGPGLELLEAARRRNLNTNKKIDGLEYLMALCLSKLGVYDRAMIYAREDLNRNVGNKGKAMLLIKQLEKYI